MNPESQQALSRWTDRKFSIWVGISEGVEIIFFRGETGLKNADVRVQYNQKIQLKLERFIAKGIEWSGIARQNNADTSKALGCFGFDRYDLCADSGSADEKKSNGG